MKVTQLFTKTSKSHPADETAKNAQLLIQAGFIDKQMAGVYTYLPLGKKVLENIVQIIRTEMNSIGGNEISLTALQPKDVWEASGRWSDEVMDVWFKTELAAGGVVGLAPTHEEPLTKMMKRFISSYKDLPVYPYQFQIKFRNELRAKSGLMRGREFWMKDLYSFSRNQQEHDAFYDNISDAYLRIYNQLGIGEITYKTFASGGSFSKYSHEFQTLSPVGEDTIYVNKENRIAINKEVYSEEALAELNLKADELEEVTAVEVGNIFTLGTKYSKPLELTYSDKNGAVQDVIMGSYGIGPSRLMGLLAEHFADEKGLVWPENVAPFKVYLAQLGTDTNVTEACSALYKELNEMGFGVLWDDRSDARPGEKFADADLYGIPYRIVVSNKTITANKYELKSRKSSEVNLLTKEQLVNILAS